jgi:hypothetical protein
MQLMESRRALLLRKRADQRGAVSLWDLLTVMAGAVALGGSWPPESIAMLGGFNYSLRLMVGVLVGIACIWFIRTVGKKVLNGLPPGGNATLGEAPGVRWRLRALYLGAFGWLIVSGLIGFEVNRLLFRQ